MLTSHAKLGKATEEVPPPQNHPTLAGRGCEKMFLEISSLRDGSIWSRFPGQSIFLQFYHFQVNVT